MEIFDNTISTLNRALDLRAFKNKLISSNIANVDTPHYRAFDLIVKENMDLKEKQETCLPLRVTNRMHISNISSPRGMNVRPVQAPYFTLKGDKNTVDMGKMMGEMAKNSIMYNADAQLISKKFQDLKYAIQEGK